MEDLPGILVSPKDKENCTSTSHENSEADDKLLHQACLISKAVPRRTNRTKWKEESGFAPNMLLADKWFFVEKGLGFFKRF